jgi:hypothetical protein
LLQTDQSGPGFGDDIKIDNISLKQLLQLLQVLRLILQGLKFTYKIVHQMKGSLNITTSIEQVRVVQITHQVVDHNQKRFQVLNDF